MRKKTYRTILMLCLAISLFLLNKTEAQAGWQWDTISRWNVENMKTYNDFQYLYIPETDSIRIVGYTGSAEVVVVPSEIEGKPVKMVAHFGDYTDNTALYQNSVIKEIHIPDGVQTIGGFTSCTNLEKIRIPDSVQEIGAEAFSNCKKLKEVNLPASVTQISKSTFAHCEELTKVYIPYGIKAIEDGAFAGCSSLKEVSIPDSVTKIGQEAFCFCYKLSKVKLSKNLTVIKEACFSGCNIKSIQIPKKVTKIEKDAFASNPLKEITIPTNVKSIGYQSFAYCEKLKKVTIKGTKMKKIGKRAFYLVHKKATFDVPNKLVKQYKKRLLASKSFKNGKVKIK